MTQPAIPLIVCGMGVMKQRMPGAMKLLARGLALPFLCALIGSGHARLYAADAASTKRPSIQGVQQVLSRVEAKTEWLEQRQQFEWRGAPYGLTGMPVTLVNAQRRWTYGGRLHLANYSVVPFRFRVVSEWVRSSGDDSRLVVKLAVPDIGSGFGLKVLFDLGRAEGRFHGWGNSSSYNQSYTDHDSPQYRETNYYSYFVQRRRALLMLSRPLTHALWLDVGAGLEDAETKVFSDQSLLMQRAPGKLGNTDFSLLTLALRWDTRDDPAFPSTGGFHEWTYERSENSLLGAFAGSADTGRLTITDRRYLRLRPRLVLATRTIFEVLDGTVPMDLYGEVGSSFDRVDGLGGNNSLRGMTLHRFMDDVRFLSNSELRYMLHSTRLLSQFVEINGVVFVDVGRVSEDLGSFALSAAHGSVGGGLRFVWNRDFTMRVEAAHSGEQNSALTTMERNF